MSLPMYIITRKCLPGGRRLATKPKVSYTYPPATMCGYGARQLPAIYRPANVAAEVIEESNTYASEIGFQYWEFRYWAVETFDKMQVAVCRACEAVETSKEKRKTHHKNHKCTTTLVTAYRLLLKGNMRCVMCDAFTTFQRFGVPVCRTGNCIKDWYFNPCPNALSEALRLSAQGVI